MITECPEILRAFVLRHTELSDDEQELLRAHADAWMANRATLSKLSNSFDQLEAERDALERENKFLRANCSKSVLRRLDAQLGNKDEATRKEQALVVKILVSPTGAWEVGAT